jgi:hypothetical protein
MSRSWKKPNTSLPGWNYPKLSLSSTPRKLSKKQLKRRKYLSSRRYLNLKGQPNNQRFITAKSSHSCPCCRCQPSPELWMICRLTMGNVTLLSRWHRLNGNWRCTDADPEIEWFTRLNNPALVSSWITTHNFSVTWSKGQPSRSAKQVRDEHIPADSYQAQNASVPQGNNTDTSLNDPSPKFEADSGLERNGVKSPRRLIAGGVPGTQFALANR